VACWQTSKKIDHIEETDDRGVTTLRDRERFTQSLTLIYADGRQSFLRTLMQNAHLRLSRLEYIKPAVSPKSTSTHVTSRWICSL
jgi:2-polyprenyl-6-methoxyphenol hydroxylase-like FAD-dependent oxidoreductase